MSPKTPPVKCCSADAAPDPDGRSNPLRPLIRRLLTHWLPVFVYGLFIFIQSSCPSPDRIPDIQHIDKLLHLGAYTVMGFLFVRALTTTGLRRHPLLMAAFGALLSILSGISDEIHQYFVPARDADILDAAADVIGSIIGAGAAAAFFVRRRIRRRAPAPADRAAGHRASGTPKSID